MGPDRTNYEIWIIDYLDGTLPVEKEALLLSFLDKNPDIREEFADLVMVPADCDSTFRYREKLKRIPADLDNHQFEMLCAAALEKDLTIEMENELKEIISVDSERDKIYRQINSTKIAPPQSHYSRKPALRRLTASQKILRTGFLATGIAATVMIMIVILKNHPKSYPLPDIATLNIAVPGRSPSEKSQNVESEKTRNYPSEPGNNVKVTEPKADNGESSEAGKAVTRPVSRDTEKSPETNTRAEISKLNPSGISDFNARPGTKLAGIKLNQFEEDQIDEVAGPGNTIKNLFRGKGSSSEKKTAKSKDAFDIANAGITKLNKLFGWEMSLQKSKDRRGEVKSVQFTSKLVKVSAPVKKGEPLP